MKNDLIGISRPPDWPDIQRQFHDYIAAYKAGDIRPECRNQLFSSIYQAVHYLSVSRYRHFAGYGTRQTDYALDGVQNLFWKIDGAQSQLPRSQDLPESPDLSAPKRTRKPRTFTSLVTEEYRDEAPIGHFLSSVVSNALRDWFREQNRRNKLNLQLHDDMYKEIVEIGCAEIPAASVHLSWGMGQVARSPEEQVELNELKKRLSALPLRDQKLLDLYYFQGLSTAEIAMQTGVNASTVRTQISRATQVVRDTMS